MTEDDGQEGADVAQDGADLVQGAFAEAVAVPTDEPTLKSWEPWHLPRKHYCRIQQWCRCVQALLQELDLTSPPSRRPLRYLSLPGEEFLDVRSLAGTLDREDVRLQFVGFSTSTSRESSVSYSEVRALAAVEKERTEVINARLEEVATEDSLARRNVSRHLPLDVVNLDLCQSVLAGEPGSQTSLLQSLRWLLEEQFARSGGPWVLFLTTRLDRDAAHPRAIQRVLTAVERNLANESFALTATQLLAETDLEAELRGEALWPDEVLAPILSLALGKWLLAIAAEHGWTIDAADCVTYQVHATEDMYSLVYRFRRVPIIVEDLTGLTAAPESPRGRDEVTAAVNLVAKTVNRVNVDQLLREDSMMLEKTMRQCGDILATARRDPEEWKQWAIEEMERRGLTS